MKHKLLEKIGTLFTEKWVKGQNNSKLAGFTVSAEHCLIGQKDYTKGKFFSTIFLIAGIYLLFFQSLISGGIFLMIGVGMKFFTEKVLYEGLTSKKVSQDWKLVRTRLLKSGVLKQGLHIFKKDYSRMYRNFIPEDIVRPLLVRAIDEVMRAHYSNLRKAERDGFPQREANILSEMEDLEDLAEDLGLQMKFEDPTKVVRLMLTRVG